ncbi:MAG: YggT family protein [Acidobacteria bacterium]|nr:YggT family protein [Acidobacteriota bacterium]
MILVHEIISLYIWVLIISALLSWFPTTDQSGGLAATKRFLWRITEPVLRPLRQIVPRPRIGGVGIDFSVLVAIILLEVLNTVI